MNDHRRPIVLAWTWSSKGIAMRILKIFLFSALLTTGFSVPAFAAVAVIVHPDNGNTLNATQVRKIYLGKARAFPDGTDVSPIDQDTDSADRAIFIKLVLKKDEGNLNSYWARMLFSSKGKPPRVVSDTEAMKKYISSNKDAIGYIDASKVDSSVKVILLVP